MGRGGDSTAAGATMHAASEVGIGMICIEAGAAAGAAGADDSGIGTAAESVGEEIAEGVYLGGSIGQ